MENKMKKIYWNLFGKEIIFNLNWIEFFILKRIFKKQNYKILKKRELKGQKINLVIIDEAIKYE